MKKIITILVILLTVKTGTAQIMVHQQTNDSIIGSVKRGFVLQAELTIHKTTTDSLISILFKNEEFVNYPDYQSLIFAGGINAMRQFQSIVDTCFKPETPKDFKIHMDVGTNRVTITTRKFIGSKYAVIITNRGFFTLSKNESKKLFN